MKGVADDDADGDEDNEGDDDDERHDDDGANGTVPVPVSVYDCAKAIGSGACLANICWQVVLVLCIISGTLQFQSKLLPTVALTHI